jgi:multimeric flavodoxin WrbA
MSNFRRKEDKPSVLLIGCSNRSYGDANTDIALNVAGLAMKGLVNYEQYSLRMGYPSLSKIRDAKGLIIATPAYFGMYSSMLQEFLLYLKRSLYDIFPKVVGFICVGAKRNGGQETTITFGADDFMRLGACVVNDGAPISQFGGVCVAGNKGDIKKDKDGLEVCGYLGRRVAETALILQNGKQNSKVLMKLFDTKKLEKDNNVVRCYACNHCPNPERKEDYGCRIKDDMRKLHSWILEADGLIPQNFGLKFFERTRYLRRDNYRLTYHVIKIKDVRHIPMFIKQNSILCRKHFREYCSLVKTGREKVRLKTQIYEPRGYEIPLQCQGIHLPETQAIYRERWGNRG